MLELQQIPLLSDNYAYLIRDSETKQVAVIDPSEATPVLKKLQELHWSLNFILNTHHHYDHTGGNTELANSTGAKIGGAAADKHRIPGLSIPLKEGDEFSLGKSTAKIIEIDGHTLGHIAFWFDVDQLLFCGDTLFSIGCGRLFEGTAEQMWKSLQKIKKLPPSTQICCGHEYTEANIDFAKTLPTANKTLSDYEQIVKQKRSQGFSTIPCLLETELKANPFLMASNVKDFARVRTAKNHF